MRWNVYDYDLRQQKKNNKDEEENETKLCNKNS